jgi:predicted RNase H-like HicB family nuclease
MDEWRIDGAHPASLGHKRKAGSRFNNKMEPTLEKEKIIMKDKSVYPIFLEKTEDKKAPYLVYVPDFDAYTQGKDIDDAVFMAEDLIGISAIDLEDDKKPVPRPSDISSLTIPSGTEVVMIPVDFKEYRARAENRSVRKNVTIPSWLNAKAEEMHVNFSAILQDALKQQLGVA